MGHYTQGSGSVVSLFSITHVTSILFDIFSFYLVYGKSEKIVFTICRTWDINLSSTVCMSLFILLLATLFHSKRAFRSTVLYERFIFKLI